MTATGREAQSGTRTQNPADLYLTVPFRPRASPSSYLALGLPAAHDCLTVGDRHSSRAKHTLPPLWRQVRVSRHIVRAAPERLFCRAALLNWLGGRSLSTAEPCPRSRGDCRGWVVRGRESVRGEGRALAWL